MVMTVAVLGVLIIFNVLAFVAYALYIAERRNESRL